MDFEIPEAGADEYFAECAYPPKPPSLGLARPSNPPSPSKKAEHGQGPQGARRIQSLRAFRRPEVILRCCIVG